MSVFTPVSIAEARALLEHYTLGEVERLEGIAQGVENTNYFLTTTTGEYVLTLFEHMMPAHQRGRGSADLDRFLLLSADRLHLGMMCK